jgi:hypothetical protein
MEASLKRFFARPYRPRSSSNFFLLAIDEQAGDIQLYILGTKSLAGEIEFGLFKGLISIRK